MATPNLSFEHIKTADFTYNLKNKSRVWGKKVTTSVFHIRYFFLLISEAFSNNARYLIHLHLLLVYFRTTEYKNSNHQDNSILQSNVRNIIQQQFLKSKFNNRIETKKILIAYAFLISTWNFEVWLSNTSVDRKWRSRFWLH